MANIKRTFEKYSIEGVDVYLDDNGDPQKRTLGVAEYVGTFINDTIARRQLRLQNNLKSLPRSAQVYWTPVSREVRSMTVEEFIEHSTVVSSENLLS